MILPKMNTRVFPEPTSSLRGHVNQQAQLWLPVTELLKLEFLKPKLKLKL